MRWHRHLIAMFFAGALCLVSTEVVAEEAPQKIVIHIDTQVLLTLDGPVKSFALGDNSIASAGTISATELLLLGMSKGETSLLVSLKDGSRLRYLVRVLDDFREKIAPAQEVGAFLGEMPGITIRVAANGLISLEGRPQTAQDAVRLRQAIEIFPEIRDLTARFEPSAFCRDESLVTAIPSVPPDESNRHGIPPVIHLQRGQRQRVAATAEVKLVVLGNCKLAKAFTTSQRELVMDGVKAGETTMLVWFEDRAPVKFRVLVEPIDVEKTGRELRALIGEMEGVLIRVVGNKVYVEGTPLTTDDRNRVDEALKRYPELRDLTRDTCCDCRWPKGDAPDAPPAKRDAVLEAPH